MMCYTTEDGRSNPAATDRSLPPSLARYRASSTMCMILSVESVAPGCHSDTPRLAVIVNLAFLRTKGSERIRWRNFSAIASAPSSEQLARIEMNSSPPNRQRASSLRSRDRMRAAACWRTSSPASCPNWSLTVLK